MLPKGVRVYAVGDIHGRFDLLETIHAGIDDELARGRPERTVIVYIGDYIDRGDRAADVVECLSADRGDGIERVFLKGNHEDMMLGFLGRANSGGTWMMNGGVATLRSYGVKLCDLPRGPEASGAARERFRQALPPAHMEFFKRLVLSHVEGEYLFVHAGIRPGVAVERQNAHDLLWIRQEFLVSAERFSKVIVHGHTVHATPEVLPHRIGIDTGAYMSDTLTCIALEEGTVRFLQT